MKILRIILGFIMVLFISCDNAPDNEVIFMPFPHSYVYNMQSFSYKTSEGDNLFMLGIYKEEYLSLIATDENYNDLYINGVLVADIEDVVSIADIKRDEQGNIISLNLGFGRTYSYDEANNSAIAYYKLKYDDNKYDTITVHYYYSLKNGTHHYITKVVYNGIEYPANEFVTIEIIKEE